MLKNEKFYVRANTLKKNNEGETLDVFGLVKTLVRNTELATALEKKAFRDGKKTIGEAYVNADPMTLTEEEVRSALGRETDAFLKAREDVLELQKEVDCLPIDEVTSLCPADRVQITLMAHAIYKKVQLESWIFDPENGGVEISSVIQGFYKKGSLKAVKETLRPIFNNLLGKEGDYFYGIRLKRSDFPESDLRNFLAAFGGNAKRATKKVKKDGKEEIEFSDFSYVDKSENKKVQLAAFTDLCAVIYDNAKKHVVIKEENGKEGEPEK